MSDGLMTGRLARVNMGTGANHTHPFATNCENLEPRVRLKRAPRKQSTRLDDAFIDTGLAVGRLWQSCRTALAGCAPPLPPDLPWVGVNKSV